jgi:hypothetical protein
MFERLKYLYESGKLSVEQLDVAVSKEWINVEQKELIMNLG